MKLTPTDLLVLNGRASGQCCQLAWRWVIDGKNVSRQVRKLEKAGLIACTIFRDNRGTTNPTALGRDVLNRKAGAE